MAFQTTCNKPGAGVRVADIVPGEKAEEGANILVESGDVPEDYFCRHKQKLSPIGDVFSSSLSGRQRETVTLTRYMQVVPSTAVLSVNVVSVFATGEFVSS